MILSELIEFLEAMPADAVASPAFGKPFSYRGYYTDVAFDHHEKATAAEMLAHARSALGATFEGYKGGEYPMNGYTECWIASWGTTCGSVNLNTWVLRAMFGLPLTGELV